MSRILAAVVFCATVLALYAVALRVMGARRAATFGALLLVFKLVAWPSFTAFYYWDLAFCFGCGAAATLSVLFAAWPLFASSISMMESRSSSIRSGASTGVQ